MTSLKLAIFMTHCNPKIMITSNNQP